MKDVDAMGTAAPAAVGAIIEMDETDVAVQQLVAEGTVRLVVDETPDFAAIEKAKYVIAQINPNVPRTHGDSFVHVSNITHFVYHLCDLPEVNYSGSSNKIVEEIGKNVASLVEDGATLQMGIGNIPDQVLKNLTGHQHLGIHTEMFSDGVIPLLEKGIIDNSLKKLHKGKSVTGFLVGTRKLYDFVLKIFKIRKSKLLGNK